MTSATTMQSGLPGPSAGDPSAPFEPGKAFIRNWIQGNYFYFLSAALMMFGCCLLMRGSEFNGEVFLHKLYPLMILQGYEAAVILVAGIIVWRLGRLDDAGSLLLIELALLLDPTFFANAFLTMLTLEGNESQVWGTNLICLGLVPLKLMILSKILKFEIHPRLLFGYTAAAACIYLGPARLNLPSGKGIETEIFYTLCWAPLALVLLLPEIAKGVNVSARRENFASLRQTRWIPRLSQLMLLVIVFAHLIESSVLYQIPFYPTLFAPMLLAIAMMFIRNKTEEPIHARIVMLDVMAVIAIIISIPSSGKSGYQGGAPIFISGAAPLICTATIVALLYVHVAFVYRCRWALVRVAMLAGGGMLYWILYRINFEAVGASLEETLAASVRFFFSHIIWLGVAVEAGILYLAYRFRNAWTWRLAAWSTGLGIVHLMPESSGVVWPEAFQLACLFEMFLCHWFGDETRNRHNWAFGVMLISAIRFYQGGETVHIIFAVGIAVALAALGFILSESVYLVFALLLAVVISAVPVWGVMQEIPPAVGVLAAGAILFALGVVITFTKERLLNAYFVPRAVGTGPDVLWLGGSKLENQNEIQSDKEQSEMKYELVIERPEGEMPEPEVLLGTPLEDVTLGVSEIIRQLFMDDPEHGIYRVPEEAEEIIRRERMNLSLHQNEKLLIEFFNPDSERSALFLTTTRVIAMESAEPGASSESSIFYASINTVGRSFDTLYLTSRLGKHIGIHGLSLYQASALKKGLDILLAEIGE